MAFKSMKDYACIYFHNTFQLTAVICQIITFLLFNVKYVLQKLKVHLLFGNHKQ